MYCFYLFSEGGRFYYPGFGFGSFMFGNITAQIAGYSLIAVMLIPLGYAHVKLKRWARTLALAWLGSWLVVGAPLVLVVALILFGTKDFSLPMAALALVFLALMYFVFPAVLIRWYRGENVRRTLEEKDAKNSWLDDAPLPLLVLSSLYLFFVVILFILFFSTASFRRSVFFSAECRGSCFWIFRWRVCWPWPGEPCAGECGHGGCPSLDWAYLRSRR
jgi:Na+/H+ antiporter NhaD/arsenite permease-like protein